MRERNHTNDYVVPQKETWNDTLHQFMRGRNHKNADIVITDVRQKEIWDNILNQFMRERNYTNTYTVSTDISKKDAWNDTLNQIMRERNNTFVITVAKKEKLLDITHKYSFIKEKNHNSA